MELKLTSTIWKSIRNATMYIDKDKESFANVWLKSNGSELYVYSTNGAILYTAGYGISTEPLDVAIRIEPNAIKQADSIQISSANATFRYNGKPVFMTRAVHSPENRITFEEFFRDPGFASFYTTKSDINNALKNYEHLLTNRNNGLVPLHMYMSVEGVTLTSSDGVTVKLNATDITGEYDIRYDARKLRRILQSLYDDVYIELFKPVDTTYIRIISEEVWFVLATMTTYK